MKVQELLPRHAKQSNHHQSPVANPLASKAYTREVVKVLIICTLCGANPKVETHFDDPCPQCAWLQEELSQVA